jgi:hypothetical protein
VLCGCFDPSFLAVAFGTTTDHVFVETLGLMSRARVPACGPPPGRGWVRLAWAHRLIQGSVAICRDGGDK